jgi:hypothetical protein
MMQIRRNSLHLKLKIRDNGNLIHLPLFMLLLPLHRILVLLLVVIKVVIVLILVVTRIPVKSLVVLVEDPNQQRKLLLMIKTLKILLPPLKNLPLIQRPSLRRKVKRSLFLNLVLLVPTTRTHIVNARLLLSSMSMLIL